MPYVNIGASIGPLLGAYFAKIGSDKFLLLAACFYLISFVLILFLVQFKNNEQVSLKKINNKLLGVLNNKIFIIFLLGSIIYNICYSQYTSTFPIYIKSVTQNWTTVYTAMLVINSLGVVLLQYPITQIMNKFNIENAFISGSVLFGSTFLVLVFADQSYLFYLAMLFFTLGEIILSPLSSVLIDKIAPENQKGSYFGAYNLSFFGSSLGPVLGGAVLQFTNGTILYLLLSSFSFGMLMLFFISSSRSKQRYAFG